MAPHGSRAQPARRAARDLSLRRDQEPDLQQPLRLGGRTGPVQRGIVYALDYGEIALDFDENHTACNNKVAQEYRIVYAVELDEAGKFKDGKEPEYVEGRYNIYDSGPGMENYSPLWQVNYVVVGRDYEPNTLRSEADCLASGFRIERSTVAEN